MNTFEAIISGIVKDAVREAVAEELRKLPSLVPQEKPVSRDDGWMDESIFRERYNLKTRYILGQALKEGTVERRVLAPRKYLWRLKPEVKGK